jgi:hypothetical protein
MKFPDKPEVMPVQDRTGWRSYPNDAMNIQPDKSDAVFQVLQGDNNKSAPWGVRVYRCPRNTRTVELLFENIGGHGTIGVVNRQLIFAYTDKDWIQRWVKIPGYIPFDSDVSGTTVNIDETAMAAYKAQVALAQNTASQASYNANSALAMAKKSLEQDVAQENELIELRAQVQALQAQMLTRAQVEDIVWSKIWDVNYLIREGFRKGSSGIREVQDYLVDLATYIRTVVGR